MAKHQAAKRYKARFIGLLQKNNAQTTDWFFRKGLVGTELASGVKVYVADGVGYNHLD